MDKSPNTIRKTFDRIAPTYDILNATLSFSIDNSWRRTTISVLELTTRDKVLDVATGTGDLAIRALQAVPCKVVGIDLSRNMLLQATRKAVSHVRAGRFCPVQGDALAIPVESGAFTKAMVAFGMRNVQNLEGFLDEIYRVLKGGGRMAVLEFSVPRNKIFRPLYLTYFRHILPAVGGVVSGDCKAYKYLQSSVEGFPPPLKLEHVMKKRGFRMILSKPLSMGIVHLYLMEKAQQ